MPLPINLNVSGRLAVVIGGGTVARRKVRALGDAGARVRLVAPEVDRDLFETLRALGAEIVSASYAREHLNGALLVIAATNDRAVNARVVEDARAANVWACDASDPERGDFTFPAVARIDEMTIAVDTSGNAPAFSRRIAMEISEQFGDVYARAARTLKTMRDVVLARAPQERRAGVMRALAALDTRQLAEMNTTEAEAAAESAIGSGDALVCATRASALALVQAKTVAAKIAQHGVPTTLLAVTTTGDRVQDRPLAAIGEENLFVKELEIALRDGRAHYAVHSCKDLPSELPADMQLAAVSTREDARDVFCSERYPSFAALPAGARVGTSSARRREQLAALRDDLRYDDIRGNVDTRLRKLCDGDYDAIVLAAAGLARLGASARYVVPFSLDELVPAPGQGALAVEMRTGADAALIRTAVNDAKAELCVVAERAALAALRGGCAAPIGIHAEREGEELRLRGALAEDGRVRRVMLQRTARTAAEAERAGRDLAAMLRAPLAGKLVVVSRTQPRPSRLAETLREAGAQIVEWSSVTPAAELHRLPDAVVLPSSGSVAAAATLFAALRNRQPRPAIITMGPASSDAARAAGFPPDAVAAETSIDGLAATVEQFLAKKEWATS